MIVTQSSIWKSSVFVFLSQLSRLLTNFFIFIIIARIYGVEQFGQFSLAFTIANICLVLGDFGFDVLITTEVAVTMENSVNTIKKYFTMKLIFMAISGFTMTLIPFFQDFSSASTFLIYILVPYIILTSFTNFLYAIFRGFEKFEFETKITIISNSILLIAVLILGYLNQSLYIIMIVFIFARFISSVLGIIKVRSLFKTNIFTISYENWKKTLNKVFVFGFHFLFGNLFFMIDTVLIGVLENDEAVGLYQSAFKIMVLLLIIPDILRSSVLPLTSRLFKLDKVKWEIVNRLIVKLFLYLAIPISILTFFLSETIISLIYGAGEFKNAVPVLQVFSIIVFIRFYVEAFGLMLTTSLRQHIRMIIVLIATIFSFIFNYIIIPKYGIIGAAYCALIINLFVGIGYIVFNFGYFLRWTFEMRTLSIVFGGILITYLLNVLEQNYLIIVFSIIIYMAAIIIFGFSKHEKTLFSEYFLTTS